MKFAPFAVLSRLRDSRVEQAKISPGCFDVDWLGAKFRAWLQGAGDLLPRVRRGLQRSLLFCYVVMIIEGSVEAPTYGIRLFYTLLMRHRRSAGW